MRRKHRGKNRGKRNHDKSTQSHSRKKGNISFSQQVIEILNNKTRVNSQIVWHEIESIICEGEKFYQEKVDNKSVSNESKMPAIASMLCFFNEIFNFYLTQIKLPENDQSIYMKGWHFSQMTALCLRLSIKASQHLLILKEIYVKVLRQKHTAATKGIFSQQQERFSFNAIQIGELEKNYRTYLITFSKRFMIDPFNQVEFSVNFPVIQQAYYLIQKLQYIEKDPSSRVNHQYSYLLYLEFYVLELFKMLRIKPLSLQIYQMYTRANDELVSLVEKLDANSNKLHISSADKERLESIKEEYKNFRQLFIAISKVFLGALYSDAEGREHELQEAMRQNSSLLEKLNKEIVKFESLEQEPTIKHCWIKLAYILSTHMSFKLLQLIGSSIKETNLSTMISHLIINTLNDYVFFLYESLYIEVEPKALIEDLPSMKQALDNSGPNNKNINLHDFYYLVYLLQGIYLYDVDFPDLNKVIFSGDEIVLRKDEQLFCLKDAVGETELAKFYLGKAYIISEAVGDIAKQVMCLYHQVRLIYKFFSYKKQFSNKSFSTKVSLLMKLLLENSDKLQQHETLQRMIFLQFMGFADDCMDMYKTKAVGAPGQTFKLKTIIKYKQFLLKLINKYSIFLQKKEIKEMLSADIQTIEVEISLSATKQNRYNKEKRRATLKKQPSRLLKINEAPSLPDLGKLDLSLNSDGVFAKRYLTVTQYHPVKSKKSETKILSPELREEMNKLCDPVFPMFSKRYRKIIMLYDRDDVKILALIKLQYCLEKYIKLLGSNKDCCDDKYQVLLELFDSRVVEYCLNIDVGSNAHIKHYKNLLAVLMSDLTRASHYINKVLSQNNKRIAKLKKLGRYGNLAAGKPVSEISKQMAKFRYACVLINSVTRAESDSLDKDKECFLNQFKHYILRDKNDHLLQTDQTLKSNRSLPGRTEKNSQASAQVDNTLSHHYFIELYKAILLNETDTAFSDRVNKISSSVKSVILNAVDEHGINLLMLAIWHKSIKKANHLLCAGAKPYVIYNRAQFEVELGIRYIDFSIAYNDLRNASDSVNLYADMLIKAASFTSLELLKSLVHNGAHVNIPYLYSSPNYLYRYVEFIELSDDSKEILLQSKKPSAHGDTSTLIQTRKLQ